MKGSEFNKVQRLWPHSFMLRPLASFSVGCALAMLAVYSGCEAVNRSASFLPPNYRGRPFSDAQHLSTPPVIPGRIECALYDVGGEGVAYHDTDPVNHGSGELNTRSGHQRSHATPEIWGFRASEGVDLSYVKDFADLKHDNLFTPEKNQLYIGWAADREWCNYTVNVQGAGRYRITALYGSAANDLAFVVDEKRTFNARFPVATGSMHRWNKAEIGTIEFEHAGLHLLTLRYNKGNNFAYFEFTRE